VRTALQELADSELPENVRLRLIALLPGDAVSHCEAILQYLQTAEAPAVDSRLIELVGSVAPQRLREVAIERALRDTPPPEWVTEVLRGMSFDGSGQEFERSWLSLGPDATKFPSAAALAALANRQQAARVVEGYLDSLRQSPDTARSPKALNRQMWLRRVLCHVNGEDLLEVVAALGVDASYEDASELLRLLASRMALEGDRSDDAVRWSPTPEAMRRLIAIFSGKVEAMPIRQDTIFVLLSAMAGAIKLPEAEGLLLEAFRRQLDGWSQYDEAMHAWRRKPNPHSRPTNPHMANPLQGAAFRFGPGIVPGLVALLDHPQAAHTIPGAIVRALSAPSEGVGLNFHRTVTDDIVEGERRRQAGTAFLQPTAQHQAVTDAAANALAQKLTAVLDETIAQKAIDPQFNERQATYRVQSLAALVALIPSQTIVPPLVRALTSGFIDEYRMLDAIRALIRQGFRLSDPNLVAALEGQIERSTSGWRSHNDNYVVAGLAQLTFVVVSPALLARPRDHYTSVWKKYSYGGDVARGLARMSSETAWDTLLSIARESIANGRPSEELLVRLGSMVTRDRLVPFLELLSSDCFRSWRPQVAMDPDAVVRRVAAAISGDAAAQNRLAQLCIAAASFAADAFGLAALAAEEFESGAFLELATAALSAGRLVVPNSPTWHVLYELFTRGSALKRDGLRYHTPTSHNKLRQAIYDCAAGEGDLANACRRLLAAIEGERIEMGRPSDEIRHPRPTVQQSWTDVLYPAGAI
jgi:hypothetical protein